MPTEVDHPEPAWGDRANFIIAARLDPEGIETELRWERLWARQLSESRFEICCIPFFIYDVDLGDEVNTSNGPGREYVVQGVVKKSGWYTFRAFFREHELQHEVAPALESLGCKVERRFSASRLLAIAAPSEREAQETSNYLLDLEQRGLLEYETGRTK